MAEVDAKPPRFVWAMGLTNMIYGYGYAVLLVTVPQLLEARGVPEPQIAYITTIALTASLATFAVAPVLDCWISRRRWSVVLALLSAALSALVLLLPATSPLFATALAVDALVVMMYNSAIGGWLGAGLPKSADETIGTWFNIGNASGFGIGAQVQFWLIGHLPQPLGALLVAGIMLVPLAILPLMPKPLADRADLRENFSRLARDVGQLVRQGPVWRIIVLFLLPCGSFTLTNAFGGIGGVFHAAPWLVDAATGSGTAIIALVTALLFKPLLNHVRAPLAYLAVGSVGAAFTLSLLPLPHLPWVFVLAVLGENIAQTCAQVAQNTIMFRSIPLDSPLASSQFGLLQTAGVVPYAYMQAADGFGNQLAGGVTGSFLMDAGVSLAACALVLGPVLAWLRNGTLEPAPVDAPAAILPS